MTAQHETGQPGSYPPAPDRQAAEKVMKGILLIAAVVGALFLIPMALMIAVYASAGSR
ncbi:hypothetical protein [Streptomyces sp. NRRL F-4489]|uniref:hypothetical protein n=1 Tax=Streptomyces sp. NRRL F-4489 TaxID=1609095 RepID=UPI000ACE8DDF|nr:hypothetical protein [Streptomyces sp. NRRL F-4489]